MVGNGFTQVQETWYDLAQDLGVDSHIRNDLRRGHPRIKDHVNIKDKFYVAEPFWTVIDYWLQEKHSSYQVNDIDRATLKRGISPYTNGTRSSRCPHSGVNGRLHRRSRLLGSTSITNRR